MTVTEESSALDFLVWPSEFNLLDYSMLMYQFFDTNKTMGECMDSGGLVVYELKETPVKMSNS